VSFEPATSPITVLGAGAMGRGIAGAFAQSGFPTTVVDIDEEALQAAREAIEKRLEGEHGPLDTSTDLEGAVANAAAVVEAVPELIDLKQEVFRRLADAAPTDAVLATNTSTMSIGRIAEASDAARVIGMHFFNPVHRMMLVEVVVGRETSDDTLQRALELVELIGKDPIVVQDVPGFATSRLGLTLGNEAMRMVDEGVATAADIDKGMRLGYRHPMGPLELADFVGLDVRLNNARSMYEQTGLEHFKPPAILERLVAEGKLGKKSGAGFYDYDDAE
jgi:3-hydroxybutyryl-CoA dehydrogenase